MVITYRSNGYNQVIMVTDMIDHQSILQMTQKHHRTTYLSYIDKQGYPVIKAMLPSYKMEGLEMFYLTTDTSSNQVKSYHSQPIGSLYFIDQHFC